jgi:carbonic anhydrase
MASAQEALNRLQEGNRRFVSGMQDSRAQPDHYRRALTQEQQDPFAIILGCSDSRVPAEIVFNQGLGDLFVIRVAGNIVAPSQIGSVEFAASRFDIHLVVVLGHSQCGAVLATLEFLHEQSVQQHSEHSRSIVDRIRPAVEHLLDSDDPLDPAELCESAVRANVNASVVQLRHESEILKHLIDEKEMRIVGAEYSLETGEVEFFESLQETKYA